MIKQIPNCLGQNILDSLLTSAEVITAKQQIDAKLSGSIYFTLPSTQDLQDTLHAQFGIDISSVNSIPMRWIKGDIQPHVDRGESSFDQTYLVYLTDSAGQFYIHDEAYPIVKGTGYTFSEGVEHKTIGTGSIPRLLLGPMSEHGFAVGADISANGETDILYIKQESETFYYKINEGSWYTFSLPIGIRNTATDKAANRLKVLFITNITITNVNEYFYCNSDGIQFGSESLNVDGTRRTIAVNLNNYDGLLQNGDEVTPGYNNIYVYNIYLAALGFTTQIGAGWIGQKEFGNNATDNFFVNCVSDGDLPGGAVGSGGIVGAYAGKGAGAQLTLIGCVSSGTIGQLDGGIVGAFAGQGGGNVRCEQCYTTGQIQAFGGGIFGDYAGDNGTALAVKCYSTGSIGGNGGGIFSRYAGFGGQAYADTCYSQGAIANDAGGIFGIAAGDNAGIADAINCYSAGSIGTPGRGIYGTGKVNGTETNCYAADGSWSDIAADTQLQDVGTIWIKLGTNQEYELNEFGYTPYTVNNIDPTTSGLIQTYSQTIQAGQTTNTAISYDSSGNNFLLLKIQFGDENSWDTITMSAQSGAISTTSSTVPGTYSIILRSVGSYHITMFDLTVTSGGSDEVVVDDCCARSLDLIGVDYTTRNQILGGNILIGNASARRYAMSYDDMIRMKMAYAAKR